MALKIREDQIPSSKEMRLLSLSIRSSISEMPRILSAERKISTTNKIRMIRRSQGAKVWLWNKELEVTVLKVGVKLSLCFFVRKP